MKKIYFTIILLVALLPFANCFSTEEAVTEKEKEKKIIEKVQSWVDQEVTYQLGLMGKSALKELFKDIPTYSVKFVVGKQINKEEDGAGYVSGSPQKLSITSRVFPGSDKLQYTKLNTTDDGKAFAGKILLNSVFFKLSKVISKLDANQSLTNVINSITNNQDDISKEVKKFWNGIPQTVQALCGYLISKGICIRKTDSLHASLDTNITKNIENFLKKGKFLDPVMNDWSGKFVVDGAGEENKLFKKNEEYMNLFKEHLPPPVIGADNPEDYNKKIAEYNAMGIAEKIAFLDKELKNLTDAKDKNANELNKIYMTWISNSNKMVQAVQAHNKMSLAYNLKGLRGTVIHELCHPLTMQYYFLRQDEQRPYYEGVNVLISGAYELSQRYCSKIEYFARINGEYKEFCEARMADLNMSELAIPSFIQLKYLSNLARKESITPEKTLATALGIISQYSNTTAEEDKRALREILKQYVAADTAEERNTAVDGLLNHKIGTNEFYLISSQKNRIFLYKKNETRYYYAIKNSDELTGIAYCEIIESDVNKGSSRKIQIHRLKFENWKLNNCDEGSFEGENLYTVEKDGTRKQILDQEKCAVLDAQKQINSK